MDHGTEWLTDALRELRKYKALAERALEQLPERRWFERLDPELNSVALVMKHMTGNMRSRWTDFLTSDGEMPDLRRDGEFEEQDDTPASIRARWEDGWARVFAAIEPLTAADLGRTSRSAASRTRWRRRSSASSRTTPTTSARSC